MIGLNAELLQIFVQRFANITLDDDREDKDKKWVKELASERLERAKLINKISKSILVANACETSEGTKSSLIYILLFWCTGFACVCRDALLVANGDVRGKIGGNLKYLEDTPMLGEIPDENQIVEGNVFQIHRYEDENNSWVASLYIRQHLVGRFGKVRSFLNDTGKRRLYATGAPGCGKTCFVWMLVS
jgi:GTPase SAR1 family protein